MILPILVLMLRLQDNSGEIAAQRAEISRLQNDVQRVTDELRKTQAMLESEQRPFCSSQSRLDSTNLRITDPATPIRLTLFAMVSNPSDACLPAEIRITATYQDSVGAFVCSGTVSVLQNSHIQNTLAELRPYESETFLKWWDGPTLKQQTLVCRDFKGDEVRNPSDLATLLRLYVTAFPKRGGLSTSEIQLSLPRAPRP
jgi:hypothetical protein